MTAIDWQVGKVDRRGKLATGYWARLNTGRQSEDKKNRQELCCSSCDMHRKTRLEYGFFGDGFDSGFPCAFPFWSEDWSKDGLESDLCKHLQIQ